MADILIKNMEMPKGCYDCPLCDSRSRFDGNEWHCWCVVLQKEVSDDGGKNEDCPLIEVPPHGRLVDIDRMISASRARKFFVNIESSEDLADFLETYADLNETDHTVVIEASK